MTDKAGYQVCPNCAHRLVKDAGLKHKSDCPIGILEDAEKIGYHDIHTSKGQLNAIAELQKKVSWLNVKELEILSSMRDELERRLLTARQTRLILDISKRLQKRRQSRGPVSGGGGPGTGKRR